MLVSGGWEQPRGGRGEDAGRLRRRASGAGRPTRLAWTLQAPSGRVAGALAVTEIDGENRPFPRGHLGQGSTHHRLAAGCARKAITPYECRFIVYPPLRPRSPAASRIICTITSSTSRPTASIAGLENAFIVSVGRIVASVKWPSVP